MSFAAEWEQQYSAGAHMSVWPWSDVVSLVRRHLRPLHPDLRVLELGAGAGANIPFMLSLGIQYHAVEGSETAVAHMLERFPALQGRIAVGDFTQALPFEGAFDLILDRASVTSNTHAAVKDALRLASAALRPGGLFIGIDWYSTQHAEYERGTPVDEHARLGTDSGQFAGVGPVHFADEAVLRQLFAGFDLLSLEHKLHQRVIPAEAGAFASWNLVARKPLHD